MSTPDREVKRVVIAASCTSDGRALVVRSDGVVFRETLTDDGWRWKKVCGGEPVPGCENR